MLSGGGSSLQTALAPHSDFLWGVGAALACAVLAACCAAGLSAARRCARGGGAKAAVARTPPAEDDSAMAEQVRPDAQLKQTREPAGALGAGVCEAAAALLRWGCGALRWCCGALRWCCGAQFAAAAGGTPPPGAAVWALPSHGYVRSSSPPQRARGVGGGARAREEATAPLLPPGERRSSGEVTNYALPSCNNHSLAGPRATPTPTRKLEFDEGLGLSHSSALGKLFGIGPREGLGIPPPILLKPSPPPGAIGSGDCGERNGGGGGGGGGAEGAAVIGVAATRTAVATPHTHASAATPTTASNNADSAEGASPASSHLLALQERMRTADPARAARAAAARREFAVGLQVAWGRCWKQVKLHNLPHDEPTRGLELVQREPHLHFRLGELLRGSFEPLHDVFVAAASRAVLAPLEQQPYLAPSLATSLPSGGLRLPSSEWLSIAHEAALLGHGHGDEPPPRAERERGNATTKRASAAERRAEEEAWAAAAAAAAAKRVQEARYLYNSVVRRRGDKAAGRSDGSVSLMRTPGKPSSPAAAAGLSFPEFVELLILCACWASPPPPPLPPDAEHVVRACGALLRRLVGSGGGRRGDGGGAARGVARANGLAFRRAAFASQRVQEG